MQEHYKNTYKIHHPLELEAAQAVAEAYLRENSTLSTLTGEIKEYYPDITRSKSRKKTSLSKTETKLMDIADDLMFYTLILADYKKDWARYDAIFTDTREIREHVKEIVVGPFIANMEVSAYTGGHVHIICQEQDHHLLKSGKKVDDFLGLSKYLSKSIISYDDKATHPEIYKAIVGFFLLAKSEARKEGKRLGRKKFSRLR